MTRDEFIDGYLARSGLGEEATRLPTGYAIGDLVTYALPCACGDDVCGGWAMVSAESVGVHFELYAPAEDRAAYEITTSELPTEPATPVYSDTNGELRNDAG